MDNLDAIKEDWKERSVGINKSAKILTQSLDDFNDILDEHAETGDVEIVKDKWKIDIKKAFTVLKCHPAKISEYDERILASTSDGRTIEEGRKTSIAQIEK